MNRYSVLVLLIASTAQAGDKPTYLVAKGIVTRVNLSNNTISVRAYGINDGPAGWEKGLLKDYELCQPVIFEMTKKTEILDNNKLPTKLLNLSPNMIVRIEYTVSSTKTRIVKSLSIIDKKGFGEADKEPESPAVTVMKREQRKLDLLAQFRLMRLARGLPADDEADKKAVEGILNALDQGAKR